MHNYQGCLGMVKKLCIMAVISFVFTGCGSVGQAARAATLISVKAGKVPITLQEGETAGIVNKMHIWGIYSDGSKRDLTVNLPVRDLATGSPAIAALDGKGHIIGLQPGRTTLVVKFQGKRINVPVVVTGRVTGPAGPIDGQKIVNQARMWLGVHYLFGGDSRKGIDCSHFVNQIYNEAGYAYNYMMATGFPGSGKFVRVSAPQAGDIILFGLPGREGHVGIVVDPVAKQFIGAQSKGVAVASYQGNHAWGNSLYNDQYNYAGYYRIAGFYRYKG